MPLGPEGYTALRAADFLDAMQSEYVAQLGAAGLPTDVDFERDTVLGLIFSVVADRLGEIAEGTQALYDAFDVGNAEGAQLDNLCALVGLTRQTATASTATLTLTGTPATIVPAGSIVEGGGDGDTARWTTDANATIGGGGTITVAATCTETGATVATIGAIDTILTPVSGWTAVSNAAAATVGQATESDADLRTRRAASLVALDGPSALSIRSSLLALDYVEAAVVIENDTDASAVVQGVTLPAHSIGVVVYPSTLTLAQEQEIAGLIYAQAAAGVYTYGADVVETVTGTDGSTKTIRFNYAAEVQVDVVIVLTMADGYDVAEAIDAVETAVTAYFADLPVGSAARRLELFGLVDDVAGVVAATCTLNAGTADITATAVQKLVLDVLSVS